mgnify:FL=1
MGAISMRVYSQSAFQDFGIASSNIEPDNCVVHSLSYRFTLGDFGEEDWGDWEDWDDFE